MYSGTIYLDFDGENHYKGQVSRCILREHELALDFNGVDEGHVFEGSCILSRTNNSCTGEGTFTYKGKSSVSATVKLTLELDEGTLILSGTWKDSGDAEEYQLDADLQQVGSS
jgi:hypothetical protein